MCQWRYFSEKQRIHLAHLYDSIDVIFILRKLRV